MTYHTLFDARLVAGSKLTKDMSHPPTSYKEGVIFPIKYNKKKLSEYTKAKRHLCGPLQTRTQWPDQMV